MKPPHQRSQAIFAETSARTDATKRLEYPGRALLPLVYSELRRLAQWQMTREVPRQTLQVNAPVHDAWLRLVGNGNDQWEGRRHFFAAAAEAMRRILIENVRRKNRLKRGGQLQRLDLEAVGLPSPMGMAVSMDAKHAIAHR